MRDPSSPLGSSSGDGVVMNGLAGDGCCGPAEPSAAGETAAADGDDDDDEVADVTFPQVGCPTRRSPTTARMAEVMTKLFDEDDLMINMLLRSMFAVRPQVLLDKQIDWSIFSLTT